MANLRVRVPKMNFVHCKVCKMWYIRGRKHSKTSKHLKNIFKTKQPVTLVESAAKNKLQTFFLKNFQTKLLDMFKYMKSTETRIIETLQTKLRAMESIKANILLHLLYVKPEERRRTQMVSFKTIGTPIYQETDLKRFLSNQFNDIMKESVDFYMKESGWVLNKIYGLELRVNKFYALDKGSSYIPLPFRSNCVLNCRNNDEKCFMYSMLGKFLPKNRKHKNLPCSYKNLENKYDFSCFKKFPVALSEIPKFEKLNNLSISVFRIKEEEERASKYRLFPLKVAEPELENHTDLLYISDPSEQKFHYAWMGNFENLVRKQIPHASGGYLFVKNVFHTKKHPKG